MFDCLLPCLPRARQRRQQHQEAAERSRQREAELDARERRLQEREAAERRGYEIRVEKRILDHKLSFCDAVKSLETALGVWGGREGREECGRDALREARRLVEDLPWSAKSAMAALIKIGEVARSCDREAACAVKAAERAVRDVVVLRCHSHDNPWERSAFFLNAEQAFGQPLVWNLKIELCVAFDNLFIVQKEKAQAHAKATAELKAKAAAQAATAKLKAKAKGSGGLTCYWRTLEEVD